MPIQTLVINIHNSLFIVAPNQKLSKYPSISKQNKQTLVQPYNELLLGNNKEHDASTGTI